MVSVVHAATVSYTPLSSQNFSSEQEMAVKLKLEITATEGTNYYLRGVFYKDGSSNYCGLTWNGSNFYAGPYTTNDGWKNFSKITIKDNTWEGELKVKIDNNDSGCKDSGSYLFKIERFTESGSGTFDAQDALMVIFALPSPTLIPTPTLNLIPTKISTVTIKSLTPTKSSPSTQIAQVTHSSNISQTPKAPQYTTPNPHYLTYKSSDAAVLRVASESSKKRIFETPSPTLLTMNSTKRPSLMAFLFSTIGAGLLILCAILAIRIYKRN